jgi:hypothetical protein
MQPAELLAWLLATITAELDQQMGSALIERALQHAKDPDKAPLKVKALYKVLTSGPPQDGGPEGIAHGAAP